MTSVTCYNQSRMKKAAATKTTTGSNNKPKPGIDGWAIGLQFLDTSWRVALPIVVLSYAGITLDKHSGTKPLFTLIGFFTALAISTGLVFVQIKTAYPGFFRSVTKSDDNSKRGKDV